MDSKSPNTKLQNNIQTIKEPPQDIWLKWNLCSKKEKFKQWSYQICEICYKPYNVIICSICKNYFHLKCLKLKLIPIYFYCPTCKDKFNTIISEETSNNSPEKAERIISIYDLSFESLPKSAKKDQEQLKLPSTKIGNKRKRDKNVSNLKYKLSTPSNNQSDFSLAANPNNKMQNNWPQIPSVDNKLLKKRGALINCAETLRKEKENRIVLSYEHSNAIYKRRKIKIGPNYNVDMYEFTDRYEKQINFDEEEYERGEWRQVWSVEKNPLSQEEWAKYWKTARLFWTYRNFFWENEVCGDFFDECDRLMKEQKVSDKVKGKVDQLTLELKGWVRRGVDLNCHYDEMALKMWYTCKFKTKVALLFLYKQLNPYVEEIEEGFKNDILFFQSEIIGIINDRDFDLDN